MQQSHSWEANSHPDRQEIPRFYKYPRFSIVFTTARHWSLSWSRSIHKELQRKQETTLRYITLLRNISAVNREISILNMRKHYTAV